MGNYTIVFYGTEKSASQKHELKLYCNDQGELFITIDDGNDYPQFICLDKPTAIKLSKVLKTEINKLESGGFDYES